MLLTKSSETRSWIFKRGKQCRVLITGNHAILNVKVNYIKVRM